MQQQTYTEWLDKSVQLTGILPQTNELDTKLIKMFLKIVKVSRVAEILASIPEQNQK